MMLPCFKCENCNTSWIVDIYTDSKDGIIQEFISSTCCPICGRKKLRVCFIKKMEDKIPDLIQDPIDEYNNTKTEVFV